MTADDHFHLHVQACLLTQSIAALEQQNTDLILENASLKAGLRACEFTLNAKLSDSSSNNAAAVQRSRAALESEMAARQRSETLLQNLNASLLSRPRVEAADLTPDLIEFYKKIHDRNVHVEEQLKRGRAEGGLLKKQVREATEGWREQDTRRRALEKELADARRGEAAAQAGHERERRGREDCMRRVKEMEKRGREREGGLVEKATEWRKKCKDGEKEMARLHHVFSVAVEKFTAGRGKLEARIKWLEAARES
ncbi:hypothetical protein TeGR_g3560 [Tetraparma gracilis]|uniref:Sorting nexin/Vps5-like C-terminal domain-containing protein n=1 Tax=Tetraparma gracilis TaxID=2962635 RepID=A0ABQ6NC86_9STRA|nr:hypothetical protein TeGR_g3560 [Tetraparma gracilis]